MTIKLLFLFAIAHLFFSHTVQPYMFDFALYLHYILDLKSDSHFSKQGLYTDIACHGVQAATQL